MFEFSRKDRPKIENASKIIMSKMKKNISNVRKEFKKIFYKNKKKEGIFTIYKIYKKKFLLRILLNFSTFEWKK